MVRGLTSYHHERHGECLQRFSPYFVQCFPWHHQLVGFRWLHSATKFKRPGIADLGRGTNRFQITEECSGTYIQLEAIGGKPLGTSEDVYNNFIYFKKTFDRVWHEGIWRVTKEYSIDNRQIEVIKSLYNQAKSAVLLDGNAGDFFRTTV